MEQPLQPGLYIVAGPIGNLGDITLRAIAVLRAAGVVACEDTRVTGRLLNHLGISKPMIRYDDHAGEQVRERLLALMREQPVALLSDAGTPLISDPGYRLVRAARAAGIAVTTLPGPSALIAALTISGLPSDRFLFAGFLPARAKAREETLRELGAFRATLIFYETAARLAASLAAIDRLLPGREIAVARELTKRFEECVTGSAEQLLARFAATPARGEIVLMIGPAQGDEPASMQEADAMLRSALAASKPSQAASTVARLTGLDRKALYARALELKRRMAS
ncbi:MAG: 16S rRNA (cytidine(1402)-2'-O)-methyltransferase [Novosphingobium sp.]|nr:16S rRNA (cytidine(1402)-2'-O)-methyltransferase [Novosphingobium sp.]